MTWKRNEPLLKLTSGLSCTNDMDMSKKKKRKKKEKKKKKKRKKKRKECFEWATSLTTL